MKYPLHQKVLITGATSGIGRATARIFAKRGFDVIITGRRQDRLDHIKAKYERKYAVDVQTLQFDVRNKDEVESAINSLEGPWKNIDILINNAGLAAGKDLIHEADYDDWDTMIDTNVKGLLYVTKLVGANMVERGSGHIINIGSIAGHEVYPTGSVYCATKFAVGALSKAMRLDFFDKNIRVSQISPGAVEETEFAMVRFKGDTKKAAIYSDYNPLTSRDVAKVIYFVAQQPKHVNIQEVVLTGTQQASSITFDRSGRRFDSE